MYYFDGQKITSRQIILRLAKEKRHTCPCPFCKSSNIVPANMSAMFMMECRDCGATGPVVGDYSDPGGLSETSWIYALKKCHDLWNKCGGQQL